MAISCCFSTVFLKYKFFEIKGTQMSTFSNQNNLPQLPIPALNSTLKMYITSCAPFCSTEDLEAYSSVADAFASGLGQTLQKRLLKHAEEQPKNKSWIEDWWLKLAYLSWRESCLVHSNW